jgi:hypothetical protein
MRCASSRWLPALLVSAVCDVAATAQVKVTLPSTHFSPEERTEARIVNSGRDAISYCVEAGQWSMHDGKVEATPTPFVVEKWTGKKWGILIGPDVGRMPVPQSLDSGAEVVFPFSLGEKGQRDSCCTTGTATERTCAMNPLKGAKSEDRRFFQSPLWGIDHFIDYR